MLHAYKTIFALAQISCNHVREFFQEQNCCDGSNKNVEKTCSGIISEFDFGFPYCYPTIAESRKSYLESTVLNEFGASYMMPVLGRSVMQSYNGIPDEKCTGPSKYLSISLPPHFSPIDCVTYSSTKRLGALPQKYDGNLFVTGVGSWHTALGIESQKRNGQTVIAFKMGSTHKLEAVEQSMVVPHLNKNTFPWMPDGGLSPTGIHQSSSGALLFTSKRGTTGLLAITSSALPSASNWTVNGMQVHMLEPSGPIRRIQSIVVEGKEWILTTHDDSNEIVARVLHEDYSLSDKFVLVNTENAPDGLKIKDDTLYYATDSDKVSGSGVYKVENLSQHLKTKQIATGVLFERDHIYLRPRHPKNVIEITPDGKYMLIGSGNGINWAPESTGFIVAKDMETGVVYKFGSGIRNPTALSFHGNMLNIVQMGSDVGINTYSNEADDLGSYAPGDSVLTVDFNKWRPELLAPKNTDEDDVEGFLRWIGTSCFKVLETQTCDDVVSLESLLDGISGGAENTKVHILCPKSCKSYIENI